MNLSVALENFVPNPNATKDFRVIYTFNLQYYDQTPLTASPLVGFSVSLSNVSLLGNPTMTGKVFTYKATLSNLNKVNGTSMAVSIIRPPSCLSINFNFLEQMLRNNLIAQY
jgi:hypothetical protein